ncbi:unnamed protein product, partial [Prorocentrum cordatum]
EEEEEEEEKEEGGRGIDRDAYCAVDRLSKFDRLQTCHKPNAASRMRNTYCSKLQGRTRTRLGGLQRCAKKKLPHGGSPRRQVFDNGALRIHRPSALLGAARRS